MASYELVPLLGGVALPRVVIERLLDLETRGARFYLAPEGRFRVDPAHLLSSDDFAFLRFHRQAARQAIEYSEGMVPQ